jgi:hypothetical protein
MRVIVTTAFRRAIRATEGIRFGDWIVIHSDGGSSTLVDPNNEALDHALVAAGLLVERSTLTIPMTR